MLTKNIWFLPKKRVMYNHIWRFRTIVVCSFELFFVWRTYIGWFNAYLFYLQLHHACFCLTLSSSVKYCRWFVFQIYCHFLCMCVSSTQLFYDYSFCAGIHKKLIWRNAPISSRFFACFVTGLWHTIARKVQHNFLTSF